MTHLRSLLLTATASGALLSAAPVVAQNVVTVNAVQIFGTIDPAKINDYTEYMAGVNMYEALTTLDGDGNIQPLLAESWEVSEDTLTWTFTLKEGVTFQDGSPVEAKDVVWSIERLLAINEGPSYLFSPILSDGAVTATGERTVQIVLDEVYTPFLTTTPILFVVNSDLAMENATDADPWAQDYLANASGGAGAFMLDSWNRGASMTLKAYDGYHLGWDDDSIDEVRFIVTNEEATVKALAQAGELSMSSDGQAQETYAAIGALEDYSILEYPTATNFYFKLNNQRPPTDDVNIRRALALATDYETIREFLLPGDPLAGPMPPVFADAFPDDVLPIEFDLEAARALVEESAYGGQGPIDIEMMYVAGLAFEEEIALLQKSILDTIGFNTILRPEPWNRMTELAANVDTTPGMTQVFYGATYPSPDSYFFNQYHSNAVGTWQSMDWVMSEEVDALIDEARSTANVDRQNAIYQELQRKLVEDQTSVYVLTQLSQQAMHNCLQGFTWLPMQSFEFNFHTMKWVCD
jgi:peptide/nickel transport system substrate-binding protein